MGRRKSGRDVSGWVIIDKPAGITSTSVVNKVRWAFDAKKAGHAGTLDPDATGVLAVALGEATKTIPFITDALKSYVFTVNWGTATTTDDAEGSAILTSDARPTRDAILAALPAFRGDIRQVPPKFSAVKVEGERAYDLARDDEDFDLAARDLFVETLELLDGETPDQAQFEMVCGKGGYVRSIARDLGETLGCYGHVDHLRRIWSGPFDVEDGVSLTALEALAKTPEIDQFLQPLEVGLSDLVEVNVTSADQMTKLLNGNPAQVFPSDAQYGDTVWASYQGKPLAVGMLRGPEIHPSRVFNL